MGQGSENGKGRTIVFVDLNADGAYIRCVPQTSHLGHFLEECAVPIFQDLVPGGDLYFEDSQIPL